VRKFRVNKVNLFAISIVMLLLAACGSRKEPPAVSGLLWDGVGNRLVLKYAVDPALLHDTIIINHAGEFSWDSDKIVPGIYRLQKLSGEGILLILTDTSHVYIDGQYHNFPQGAKVVGTPFSDQFFLVDKTCNLWVEAINSVLKLTADSLWSPSTTNLAILHDKVDSLSAIYSVKVKALDLTPVEKMYALIQQAGTHNLFDPWEHRELFFEIDTALRKHSGIPEIERFRQGVAFIRQVHVMDSVLRPGNQLVTANAPFFSDTLQKLREMRKPIYLQFYQLEAIATSPNWQRHLQVLERYKRAGLLVYEIEVDSVKLNALTFGGEPNQAGNTILPALGITHLPANFVVDTTGVIVARDVWHPDLEMVFSTLFRD